MNSFRRLGHKETKLDPLNLTKRKEIEELDPFFWGLTQEDLTRDDLTPVLLSLLHQKHKQAITKDRAAYPPLFSPTFRCPSLASFTLKLRQTYSSTVGVEYEHLLEGEEREFVRRFVEERIWTGSSSLDPTEKEQLRAYFLLHQATSLEEYLQASYTEKRYTPSPFPHPSSSFTFFTLTPLAPLLSPFTPLPLHPFPYPATDRRRRRRRRRRP